MMIPSLIAAFVLLQAGLAGKADAQSAKTYNISVSVDLVVLHPTVRDRKGRFASDLREQNFEVYEDGVRQSIRLFRHEDVPVTVGLVIDHSGSMKRKLPEVIAAARIFVESSRQDDEMFVVNFNDRVTFGLPGGLPGTPRFTNRPEALAQAISNTPTTGLTKLYDAVIEAREQLERGAREKKVLIVISDGGDNASTHKLREVLKSAEQSSALFYTIGIFDDGESDRNPEVLRRLARATGGVAFFPKQLDDVEAVCRNIARDIRNQYTVGYVSGNVAQTRRYRALRVTAREMGKGKLTVHARSGYIASDERLQIFDEAGR